MVDVFGVEFFFVGGVVEVEVIVEDFVGIFIREDYFDVYGFDFVRE